MDEKNGVALFVEFDIEAHKVAKKNDPAARQNSFFEDNHGGWVDYLWAAPGAEKEQQNLLCGAFQEGPGELFDSRFWYLKEDLK